MGHKLGQGAISCRLACHDDGPQHLVRAIDFGNNGADWICNGQANPEYLSVNWDSSGGGAFAVIPLNEKGKLPDQMPLFRGHTAAVLDTDW